MQPIDKLLARIKWDKDFGDAAFEIGYLDRVAAAGAVIKTGQRSA